MAGAKMREIPMSIKVGAHVFYRYPAHDPHAESMICSKCDMHIMSGYDEHQVTDEVEAIGGDVTECYNVNLHG